MILPIKLETILFHFYIQRVTELQIFMIKLMLNENKTNKLQHGNLYFLLFTINWILESFEFL